MRKLTWSPELVLLLAGVTAYVAAWFFPVIAGQDHPDLESVVWNYGYQAHCAAHDMLVRDLGDSDNQFLMRIAGATCLTNYVMVVVLALALSRPRWKRGLGWGLVACTVVNLVWIRLDSGPFGQGPYGRNLGMGYFMWVGSFAWVGLVLVLGRRPPRGE